MIGDGQRHRVLRAAVASRGFGPRGAPLMRCLAVESRPSPRRPASAAPRFSLPAARARSALCRRSRCSGTSTHLALRAADVLGVLQYDETEQNWVKEE